MHKYLIVLLLFYFYKAECQPFVTDGNNRKILEWDSSYQIQTIRFFGLRDYRSVNYQYTIRQKQRIVAEYFRHDDSSFLYVRHDSAGKEQEKGILKLCFYIFSYDIIQIPDISIDPNFEKGIFKDTIIENISYRKFGRWKEIDSLGYLWKGEYDKGKREGIWEKGLYFYDLHSSAIYSEAFFDHFRPLSKHIFKDGIEVAKFRDSSFWPEIKGKWFPTSTALDSNTYLFTREESGKIYLNFETNNSFSSLRPSQKPIMHLLEKYTGFWKQNGDLIEITEGDKVKIVQVLNITNDKMILRFHKWK